MGATSTVLFRLAAEFGINAVMRTCIMEASEKKPPPMSDHEDGSSTAWGLLGIRWDDLMLARISQPVDWSLFLEVRITSPLHQQFSNDKWSNRTWLMPTHVTVFNC